MGKTLHVANDPAAGAGSVSNNAPFGIYGLLEATSTESRTQVTQRVAGTWSKLGFRTNATGTSRVLTFRVNAANGNEAASATNSTAGFWEDTSNTDTPSVGDEINTRLTEAGTDPTVYQQRLLFEAASGHKSIFVQCGGGAIVQPSTVYFQLCGTTDGGGIVTEANQQYRFRSACTLKNLFFNAASNASDQPLTLVSRINGGNGNLTITIPASTNGIFEDTSNSDSVSDGDLVCLQASVAAGSGSCIVSPIAITAEWSATQDDGFCGTGTSGEARTASATVHYFSPIGYISALTVTTESQAQIPPGYDVTFSNLRIYISSNTYSAAGTLRFRNAGADGNQSVSLTASTTGWFEDTSNSDLVAAADQFAVSIVGGTSGSITMRSVGITMLPTTTEVTVFPIQIPDLLKYKYNVVAY